MKILERAFVGKLKSRLSSAQARLQVISGPRQVGKTTGLEQIVQSWPGPSLFCSADGQADPSWTWLESVWRQAQGLHSREKPCLLVVDEIQKVPKWSETLKKLWDQEARQAVPLRVCVLGSSAMLLAQGMTESLAGRFELTQVTHWQFTEMSRAFGISLDHFFYFGGYPGAAAYFSEPTRWAEYVGHSLLETAINRDVLAMRNIDKPALLRSLFVLACEHAAEVLSYNKMLGQLTEAGNASTLAHYQELLNSAGLLRGLQKYSGAPVARRASSPKWLPLNTALVTSQRGMPFEAWRSRPDLWGRLVEAAVGAHLAAECQQHWSMKLAWWRDGNHEVDYVVSQGDQLLAIEVKSGKPRLRAPRGLEAFKTAFPRAKVLVVGDDGLPLQEFFQAPLKQWLD